MKSWLADKILSSTEAFCAMIDELVLLHSKGIYTMQGMNLDYWYLDVVSRRAYFLAPHWMQTNEVKANQVGHWKIKSRINSVPCNLKGEWGNLAQIVIAYYIYLSQFTEGKQVAFA
jgi:hypothetical protein